jgi:hypothetical protein
MAERTRFLVAVLVPLLGVICPRNAAAQQFLVPPQYATGGGSSAVAVGDFNRDGKPDLVVLDVANNAVDVLLSNGDGTFLPYVRYAVGWNPSSIVVGDFNGDGIPDLAVPSFGVTATFGGSSIVSILLGNGDGTFQPHIDTGVGGILPQSIALGDFNGDGKLDLSVVYYSTDYSQTFLAVLLGNGDGTFRAPIIAPTAYTTVGNSGCLVAADFNGDGKLDLAGTNFLGTSVVVLLGNGDGTFLAPVDYTIGFSGCIHVGDFNGDGKVDLTVAGGNTVTVLLGNGDGTFLPHLDTVIQDALGVVGVVGDLNGDGKLDLAWISSSGDSIDVLIGKGDGTFQAPVSYGTGGTVASAVALADFNGDGKPDLVVTDYSSFAVLLNRGSGAFQSDQHYATGNTPSGEAIGDFNGDGNKDLVVVNANSNTVSVFLGNGDGTLQAQVDYPTGTGPLSVVVGDFNGDGKQDLAVANAGNNTVSVLLGNGDGTFRPHLDFASASYPQWIAAGDFNGDGKLDVAVANNGNNTVSVLLGNGDGTLQPRVDYGTGFNTFSVAVRDFDGDGKADLAVAFTGDPFNQTATPGGVAILINKGNGTFLPAVNYSSGGIPLGIVASDLNQDGRQDLVAANGGKTCFVGPFGEVTCIVGTSIGVLIGNGDGTFQAPVQYGTAAGPNSVAIGDFNGDGKPDVVSANSAFSNGNTVSVLWGNGDGTFRPRLDYVVGKATFGVAVGDFNGDHKDDLAVTLSKSNSVAVLLNEASTPAFVLSVAVAGSTDVGTVVSAPVGIICSVNEDMCSTSYDGGSIVTLNATIPPTFPVSLFSGWSGDCTDTSTCVLDMIADKSVTANFAQNTTTYTVTVMKAGTGTGRVGAAEDLGGIDCGGTCSASYPGGTALILGAAADPGSHSTGWNAVGCERALDCTVILTSDMTVTATFSLDAAVSLAVTKAGSGSGTVTSNPSGIDCGTTCSASFGTGAIVQLTATSDANSTFTGWSGACSGTSVCSLTMNAGQSTTATFNSTPPPDFSLSSASGALTAQRGGQVMDIITITPKNGSFASAIQLSCAISGPSPVPTCALSPASVTPGANSATSTLTIAAPAAAATLVPLSHRQLGKSLYAVWLPLMFGITVVGGSKKLRRRYWVLCGFLLLLFLQTACGGGNSSSGGGKQGPTNYTVTVTGASGTMRHTTQVTVTVQ